MVLEGVIVDDRKSSQEAWRVIQEYTRLLTISVGAFNFDESLPSACG